MAAISNTCMTFLKPGDTLLFSNPVYGGVNFYLIMFLPSYNIKCVAFDAGSNKETVLNLAKEHENVKMIFIETPCNPLMTLTSVEEMSQVCQELSKDSKVLLAVDNTFAGSVFFKTNNENGADLESNIQLLNL